MCGPPCSAVFGRPDGRAASTAPRAVDHVLERYGLPRRWQITHAATASADLVEQRRQLVAEQLARLAEAAALAEGRVLELDGFDAEAGGEVVSDESEPLELLVGEGTARVLLLNQPGLEAFGDVLGIGTELVVEAEGVPDERDDVGEHGAGRAADLGGVQGLVGLPQPLGCPGVRWSADRLGQFLDVAVGEPLGVGLAVEHLEGGDLVLVLVEELAERLDGLGGAGLGVDGELGAGDGVDADLVDDLLEAALHVDELLAQRRVGGERLHGGFEEPRAGGGDVVGVGVVVAGGLLGGGDLDVGVDRFDERALDVVEAGAGGLLEAGPVGWR